MANESEMNLGLALGSSSTSNQQQVESSGVGANANSRSRILIDNKTFVQPPRPLTELVWSTQNGLSIKSAATAGCTVRDEKLGPTCHVGSITPAPFLGSNRGQTDENVGEVKCVQFIEVENCSSESIPVGNMVGTCEGPHNRTTADLLPLLANEPEILERKTENIDQLGLDIGLPLKIQDINACQEPPMPKEDGSCSAPSSDKIEETAENDDVVGKDDILDKNVERDGRGDSSDCKMEVQNREESCREGNGSMESCNSDNLSSKGNKRWRFEQQLIIGSKRIKKQSQECPYSTPVVKQDSSFMNWISNMLKGVKPCQEEDGGHSLALSVGHPIDDDKTLNFVSKRLGFQTVFQSLYSKDAKRLETRTQVENKSVGDSKEIILFDKTVSNHDPDDILNQKAFGNLWIARFSPKTPSTLLTSNNSDLKSELKQVKLKENGNVLLKKKVSNHLNEIPKHPASSSGKILGIPKQMLDAIRKLRLSRTDILKWMDSRLPISSLDGYFLRLRLAKWEEGVGGAGYYVGCITDENPSKGSKKSIRVNIGDVECLVESRYISNCDFLEVNYLQFLKVRKTIKNLGWLGLHSFDAVNIL